MNNVYLPSLLTTLRSRITLTTITNMGANLSQPQHGTSLQVIGAGLPRTGTASFAEALSILLDGPVYHGGTQLCTGMNDASEIHAWIKLLEHSPPHKEDEQIVRT
jgi:hypothetical protein